MEKELMQEFLMKSGCEQRLELAKRIAIVDDEMEHRERVENRWTLGAWAELCAEECNELAQALSKLSRATGHGVYTTTSPQDAFLEVIEEYTDVIGTIPTVFRMYFERAAAERASIKEEYLPLIDVRSMDQLMDLSEFVRTYKKMRFMDRNSGMKRAPLDD